jgi:cytoskeletal protein CcmA (bactofilin family)
MIGPSIIIKGEVSGEEDLLIQGKVEGTIQMANNEVSIGESGQVNADIQAKVARVDGEVNGDVTAGEKVVISKSGNVRGNIVAPRVTLEDGAIFKGSIDMDPAGASYAKPPQSSQKAGNDAEPQVKAPGLDLKSA